MFMGARVIFIMSSGRKKQLINTVEWLWRCGRFSEGLFNRVAFFRGGVIC